MSVEVLDGSTILKFVENGTAFDRFVGDWFIRLDADGDGLLSYKKMMEELQCLSLVGMDHDCENMDAELLLKATEDVGLEEFREETRKMLLAMAKGLGSQPVQVVVLLGENNVLRRAVECEDV